MLQLTFTLGPASREETVISELLATADRFRLNASHLDPSGLRDWLTRLADLFARTGKTIPVVVDLQGAKLRIGRIEPVASLPANIRLVPGLQAVAPGDIPVPHSGFFSAARAGDVLSLNDARVTIRVTAVERDGVRGEILKNGPLSAFKGLNREAHPIPFESLSDGDARMIEASLPFPFVEYAFSFVHTGAEAAYVRAVLDARRRLIAKIERPEAMESIARLQAIAGAFDELWLCRGDLGAQAGLRRLGALQQRFSEAIPALGKPCHLAGQVLEHMTHFDEPTRTEVVHLHDTLRNGYAGIVLSDETAIGKNPVAAANFLKTLLA